MTPSGTPPPPSPPSTRGGRAPGAARRPGRTTWSSLAGAGAGAEARAAYLVRGDDPALVADAVRELLGALVGDRDPAMVVEEHGGPGSDDVDVGVVVDALTTPPFLTDRRVVVVREAGRLAAAGATRLAEPLADPLPGVVLVLAGGGGTVPAALVKAVERAGTVVETAVGSGRARSEWLVDRLQGAPVRLDARAAARLGEHLGDDLGRLRGLLDTLAATYGPGASLGATDVEPFLGTEGAVAPWELTDAIASGRTEDSLAVLERLTGPGAMHPLVVLAVLHRHYQTMLRLDGAAPRSAEDAAALVGARSVYPVKKAMEQGKRMGSARLGRAVVLLADADLDLRGRSALPDGLILQVLVARLTRLGGAPRAPRR